MADKLRELDFQLLLTLDALLRASSVTRAAEALGASQSATSHALARLRELFGDPLFVKTNRGIEPTPKALALAAPVADMLQLARGALLPAVPFDPASAERTITLCLDDMGELAILPQLMSELRQVAPRCTLQTVSVEGLGFSQVVDSGTVDLAITSHLQTSADVLHQRLYDHAFTVIVSQDCALEQSISAAQFAQLEHVVFRPHGSIRSFLTEDMAARGLAHRIRLSTPHHLIVPLLVEREGSLCAVVPQLLADTYAKFARIKILRPSFALPRIEVYQYWHRRVDAEPFNRWLRGFVRERCYRNPRLHID